MKSSKGYWSNQTDIPASQRKVIIICIPRILCVYHGGCHVIIDGADQIDKVKLNDVIMELSEIENLWYMFGILLGIPKPKLDQIQVNYGSGPRSHGRCLIETICQWKDNHDNATWSSIVQALCSMQKKQLAKRVAAKHSKLLHDIRISLQHINNCYD